MKIVIVVITLFAFVSCTKSDSDLENNSEQTHSIEASLKPKRYTGNKIGDDEVTINLGIIKWIRKRIVCDRKDNSSCVESTGTASKVVFETIDGTFGGELVDESSEEVEDGVRYNFDFISETYHSNTLD